MLLCVQVTVYYDIKGVTNFNVAAEDLKGATSRDKFRKLLQDKGAPARGHDLGFDQTDGLVGVCVFVCACGRGSGYGWVGGCSCVRARVRVCVCVCVHVCMCVCTTACVHTATGGGSLRAVCPVYKGLDGRLHILL